MANLCAGCDEYKELVDPFNYLCDKCGSGLNKINDITNPIFGYKIFTERGDEYLYGGYGKRWESATMDYACVLDNHPELEYAHLNRLRGTHRNIYPGKSLNRCFDLGHSCGIYLWKEVPEEELMLVSYGSILAKVVAWGDILEYSEGYRAEHVRILELTNVTPHYKFQCNKKFKKYGVPVSCGNHLDDLEMYAYGGIVRTMFHPEIPIRDTDVIMGWDTFLEKAIDFRRNGNNTKSKFDILTQSVVKLEPDPWVKWWHENYLSGSTSIKLGDYHYTVDATILGGKPSITLDEVKELLANTIDYRCNAVILYKGELHEAIPGGIEDLKNKRFISCKDDIPKYRVQYIQEYAGKWGWTVDGAMFLASRSDDYKHDGDREINISSISTGANNPIPYPNPSGINPAYAIQIPPLLSDKEIIESVLNNNITEIWERELKRAVDFDATVTAHLEAMQDRREEDA